MNIGTVVSVHLMFFNPSFWLWQWMIPFESDNAQKVHLGKYLYKPIQGVFALTKEVGLGMF